MAELILSPIADKIVGGLGSAAVKEIALLWGVNDDLDQLNETISAIKCVLLDAEEKQINSHEVRYWLHRLGDVVDDADNLMDEFNTEALRRRVMPAGSETVKQVRTFFSASNQLAFRLKMGCRIREIRKKLDTISNDRKFSLEVRHEDNRAVSARRGRETHSFVRQEEVIGRDEEREEIVKLLLEQGELAENVSVIPIVGMGGLGKTTLAQSAFNEETVQQHFELKMWVCVSDDFDLKLILQQIIKSATKNNNNLKDNDSMDQLQNELQNVLNGKRYLLVLDDVWEEKREEWLRLKVLLLSGSRGSRIVVTTRSKKVAEITGSVKPYQLGILDEEKSWSLFEKMAFKQKEEERDPKIVDIGRQIVERCGGVPLAIRAIGSMLYFKSSESEWFSFSKGFLGISREKEDGILSTLKLSYDNLTSHLKRCFAYCRLFPKDYRIEVETLVKLWMAQGLLQLQDPSDDQCLEDVGYGYFVELHGRSFFQEVEVGPLGVESCKMHDLMHDLATEVAGTESATVSLNSPGNIDKDTRHVSFDFNINSPKKISSSLVQARKIRTVLLLHQDSWANEWGKSTSDALRSNFKFTRTLDLHGSGITILPKSIGSFKHLRYLDLSYNKDIEMLPNSITNLVNLQTLRLNGCDRLRELPRDLKKLVNLRHLEIDGCRGLTHMPRGLSQLTNLQTLPMYILSKSNGGELKELMGLNNLKGELAIRNLEHGNDAARDYESANLKEKQYLRSLELRWIDDDEGTVAPVSYEKSLEALQPHPNVQELALHKCNYGGVKNWLSSLTNLVNLTLESCEKCQHLMPLNQFHRLKNLELSSLPCLEYINGEEEDLLLSSTIILPSLRQLWLYDLPNLKGWWREVVSGELLPCFPPCLSDLFISNCPQLSCMPLYPHLERSLVLHNTRLKPLEQTVLVLESRKCSTSTTGTEIPTTTSSSFSPLSKLTSLTIYEIGEDLQCLPEWFKSLTCLKELEIGECSKLKDLSPGIQHLTSLEDLEIENCKELEEMIPEGLIILVNNGRLRSLRLTGIHKLASLPEGLQHLTSLRVLSISDWKSLETIPEWIGNLNSLETLQLRECPKLRALPEGIRSLTCLKTLRIRDCPMLLKRCQSPIGEDWPKIAHIPRLDLDLYPNRSDDVENPSRDEHTTSLDKIKACSSSILFKSFGVCMQ